MYLLSEILTNKPAIWNKADRIPTFSTEFMLTPNESRSMERQIRFHFHEKWSPQRSPRKVRKKER